MNHCRIVGLCLNRLLSSLKASLSCKHVALTIQIFLQAILYIFTSVSLCTLATSHQHPTANMSTSTCDMNEVPLHIEFWGIPLLFYSVSWLLLVWSGLLEIFFCVMAFNGQMRRHETVGLLSHSFSFLPQILIILSHTIHVAILYVKSL